MGCEIGRIRPTNVFERAGESRMTPPASSISSQVRPRISFLRQPEYVGEVEDVLPRGGQVGADGQVLGVFEEALAGGILPQAVGEAGHGVEPAPVDGKRAHAVEGRGLAIDGAGGRPGGAPGELVLADLIGGQRGGSCPSVSPDGPTGPPLLRGASLHESSLACTRPNRQDPHLPMRYDTGRPRAVIRLRISQPSTTSLSCPAGLRARRPSSMMDL